MNERVREIPNGAFLIRLSIIFIKRNLIKRRFGHREQLITLGKHLRSTFPQQLQQNKKAHYSYDARRTAF